MICSDQVIRALRTGFISGPESTSFLSLTQRFPWMEAYGQVPEEINSSRVLLIADQRGGYDRQSFCRYVRAAGPPEATGAQPAVALALRQTVD
mmetsp:Transcript_28270/g.110992  ORF Transcript_28270/g.110992 Transcript_28270/m.110992 type:complete len:93 (-) Transcript_28270:279-557(-)